MLYPKEYLNSVKDINIELLNKKPYNGNIAIEKKVFI